MKPFLIAAAAATLWMGAASAQTASQDSSAQTQKSQPSPGTVGAMGRSSSNGVANSPEGIKAQQGSSVKASPGTVGAAPGSAPQAQPPK